MSFLQRVYDERWKDVGVESMARIWDVLVSHFFQSYVSEDDHVLDIGCGFSYFLNPLRAKVKVGVDANAAAAPYASHDVTFHQIDSLELGFLEDESFDCVFMSNLLEHLDTPQEVVGLLLRAHQLLKPGGRILILQPNFRLLGAAYFDFIDHKTILTERSMDEALEITGFDVEERIVRFLPYTARSSAPRHPIFVRLYLLLRPAWLLFGKQSFFVARKPVMSIESR